VSREYPQWDREVTVDGVVYRVSFDQAESQASGECSRHPGVPAVLVKHITLYEIRDEDDVPIDRGRDTEALRAKVLEALGDNQPYCEGCLEKELENAVAG